MPYENYDAPFINYDSPYENYVTPYLKDFNNYEDPYIVEYVAEDWSKKYNVDYIAEYTVPVVFGSSYDLLPPYRRVETWTLYVRAA